MSTQLHGIGDFVKRLERIAEECGEQPGKQKKEKDEFLRTKQRIYALLEQVREDILNRGTLLRKRGNCYETIQKGHAIRQSLDELKKSLPKLQELHKRAQGKRGAGSGQKKDELQMRYNDIRVLKRHVDEVNELFTSSTTGTDAPGAGSSGDPQASLFGLRDAARGGGRGDVDGRRALSAEEEDALSSMKRRDQDLDRQAAEIGRVVERLDPLAREIGSAAERSRLRAEAMTTDVEKAEEDLKQLNKRMAEVMQYEKNTNTCCQLVLGIALLCCVGFVFQQLN